MDILVPLVYAGNIAFYKQYKQAHTVWFEQHEHYVKQTYRNRCTIYGANGKLDLIVPIQKGKSGHQSMCNVKINYDQNWQRLHWKSLESAYRSSPYFEYYEHEFEPLYQTQFTYLHEFNLAMHKKLVHLLELDTTFAFTETYVANPQNTIDLRALADTETTQNTATEMLPYTQVFENKTGFIPNLSTLDLLFNCGPQSSTLL